jgi:hypothetical protein
MGGPRVRPYEQYILNLTIHNIWEDYCPPCFFVSIIKYLSVIARIKFKEKSMRDEFIKGLKNTGYYDDEIYVWA